MPKAEMFYLSKEKLSGRELYTNCRNKVIVARSRRGLIKYLELSDLPPGTYTIEQGFPMEVVVNDLEYIVEEEVS